MDKSQEKKISNELLTRLQSLFDLYKRKVLSKKILGSQLQQMVGSSQGKSLIAHKMEKDIDARVYLARLEDPVRWRKETSATEAERRKLFHQRLVEIFTQKDKPDTEVLDRMLETTIIPHFIAFTRDEEAAPKVKKSRVSVRD
jgi:hypothetical protein